MPKSSKYSKLSKEFAQFLFCDCGYSLSQISIRLGINRNTLRNFRGQGKWLQQRTPPFALEDLYNMCLNLMFKALHRIIKKPNQETFASDMLALKNLATIMKTIAEIAPMRKDTMRGFMKWLIETDEGVDMTFFLKKCQKYHDEYERDRELPEQIKRELSA